MPLPSAGDQPTLRQLRALSLCAQGWSYEDVGSELILSPHTVRMEIFRARESVKAKTTTHAVAICIGRGLLEVDGDEVAVVELASELVAA